MAENMSKRGGGAVSRSAVLGKLRTSQRGTTTPGFSPFVFQQTGQDSVPVPGSNV